jgi:hypothetical protein
VTASPDVVDLVRALLEERTEHQAAIARINEKLKLLREIVNTPEEPEPTLIPASVPAQSYDDRLDRSRIMARPAWIDANPPLRAKHVKSVSLPSDVYEKRILAALAAHEPQTLSELHALKLGPKQTLGQVLLSMVKRNVIVVRQGFKAGRGKHPYLYGRPGVELITAEQEVPSASADPG